MSDRERHQESDLGQEQLRRVREEGQEFQPGRPGPVPALDSEEAAQSVDVVDDPEVLTGTQPESLDPELQEDLRRAQPNPPMTQPQVDPMSDVDTGPAEDQEREAGWDLDMLHRPVPADPTDPLEADREESGRPGPTTGLMPDEVGNRPPEERERG